MLSQAARDLYKAAYPVGPTVASTTFVKWMKDEGLTPRDVAAKIHCTEMSVRAWASGRRVPTIELARRIELLCGIPVVAWVQLVDTTDEQP
jgi:ribosome-binding protein aMBF1 (putative translation factor)